MKYAFFNAEGRVESAHNDDTVTELPDGAVELTEEQWFRRFDLRLANGKLVDDPVVEPLDAVIGRAWQKIKSERDHRTENGGYKVDDKWFHSDQKSRSQQLGLVLLGANIPAGLQWKTMDGTFVTMTQQLAGQVLAAAAASDQAIFAAAETHKAAMEASQDPAAYDFSTGWPKVFGE